MELEWVRNLKTEVRLTVQGWVNRLASAPSQYNPNGDWSTTMADIRAAGTLGRFEDNLLIDRVTTRLATDSEIESRVAEVEGTTGRQKYNARRRLGTALWRDNTELWALREPTSSYQWQRIRDPRVLRIFEHTAGFTLLPDLVILEDIPVDGPHRDDQNALHHASKPVLKWANGFEIYAWRGRVVPKEVIKSPSKMDWQTIRNERNAEVRRIMLERFGSERYMKESGAKLVDSRTDALGHPLRLWRASEPRGRESLTMLEVTNSTPEPDGTRKSYFLRVPPMIRSAEEAQAWTYNLPLSDWQSIQTFQS